MGAMWRDDFAPGRLPLLVLWDASAAKSVGGLGVRTAPITYSQRTDKHVDLCPECDAFVRTGRCPDMRSGSLAYEVEGPRQCKHDEVRDDRSQPK
jgi:hypothetical protein